MFYSEIRNRAFRRVDPLSWTAALCLLAWLLAPPLGVTQDLRARSVLTASEVVEVMQDHQLPTRGVQVRLSVPITSSVTHPPLEIQAIAPLNQHSVRLRIACQDRSQCLAFFAIATYPEAIDPLAFQIKPDYQSISESQPYKTPKLLAEAPAPPASAKQTNSDVPPVLRSGSSATLDLDGDRIHVRVEVICLESGAVGDKIRVTTHDHKQVYEAEIVAPNALKGTLTR